MFLVIHLAYVEQYSPCYENVTCISGGPHRPDEKTKQCYFDVNELGDCFPGNSTHKATFGFNKKNPCLYLRLTKVGTVYA